MRSKPDGEFAASWFDDAACLWNDERLSLPSSLAHRWKAPTLMLHRPDRGATPVLFNPNAIAVSQGLRDELAAFPELEFLPVSIEGNGEFFIVHVTNAIELPPDSNARIAPLPSGNIIEIHSFSYSFTPPTGFFRILQPSGSASGRAGRTMKGIYIGHRGKRAIECLASRFLEARQR